MTNFTAGGGPKGSFIRGRSLLVKVIYHIARCLTKCVTFSSDGVPSHQLDGFVGQTRAASSSELGQTVC